jgi:peptidoglycan hydrolase-like protein with peptidoglycan-binding domain
MANVRLAAVSAASVLLVAGGGWAAYSTNILRTRAVPATTPDIATGRALVVRTDVQERTTVTAVLGHSGSYSVIAPASSAIGGPGGGTGTSLITWLPAVGATVSRSEPVYAVNGQPVLLLYGARPAWREMAPGIAGGRDVRQLNRNLAALGYGSGVLGDEYGAATEQAVVRWQEASGLPVTGTVPLGQVVFLPGPLLVSQQLASAGGPLPNGTPIVQGTGATQDVSVSLDPNLAPSVRKGNRVIVTLPDGTTDPGVVAQVSAIAQNPAGSSQSQNAPGFPQQPVIPVTIRLLRPVHGVLDQAQVQVAITSAEDANVLAVPITALLAEPGGRFAVVIVSGGGRVTARRTVPVRTGLYDEITGEVEVSGPGLAAGQYVEVPSP